MEGAQDSQEERLQRRENGEASEKVGDYGNALSRKEATEELLGCVVHSEEEAYRLYCDYGHRIGFSVRKGKQSYFIGTKNIRTKDYYCSKEGLKYDEPVTEANFNRPDTRTNCKAMIRFRVDEKGRWTVIRFVPEHNHQLAKPGERHMLRSAKSLAVGKSGVIDPSASTESHPINGLSDTIKGDISENPEYTIRDCYNQASVQEKAKQLPSSSSTARELAVQTNDHPFQSAQDGQAGFVCICSRTSQFEFWWCKEYLKDIRLFSGGAHGHAGRHHLLARTPHGTGTVVFTATMWSLHGDADGMPGVFRLWHYQRKALILLLMTPKPPTVALGEIREDLTHPLCYRRTAPSLEGREVGDGRVGGERDADRSACYVPSSVDCRSSTSAQGLILSRLRVLFVDDRTISLATTVAEPGARYGQHCLLCERYGHVGHGASEVALRWPRPRGSVSTSRPSPPSFSEIGTAAPPALGAASVRGRAPPLARRRWWHCFT
ncbi:hypothetical protein PR202_gb20954 [Eleusine coracana subsp. coracana]|uniref:FAR1 domain-containing protein n=1 Tax=Eleusine coracana subsp. coracana TaxID=191504 RepID=A0AAV5F9X8_ELECO|nr:hypothetical protein PR202_gb20954 [Eleusine coracana subsp. coracana]